jgi:catechol 2,3-dioxygenase-like lactoylglutathione lyase family enzyme
MFDNGLFGMDTASESRYGANPHLTKWSTSRRRRAPAFAIFVVTVDDLLARLAASGIPIVAVEGKPFRPAGRNAFVRGPDGLAIELVQER